MVTNLDLKEISKALSLDSSHTVSIADILKNMSDDTDVINYRLDIIEDMLQNPQITKCFKKVLPFLDELAIMSSQKVSHEVLLQETASRVGELATYIELVSEMKKTFHNISANLKSEGLRNLTRSM